MSGAHIRANEIQKATEPVRQPGRELIRQQEQGPVQAVALHVAYRRVQLSRNGLRPADLLALQRAVGNRTVQRMVANANEAQQDETTEEDSERAVRTKPTTGAAKDVRGQESDRVAGRVMAMPAAAAQRPNRTGLPDSLKSRVESLSGMSMDNVNVHYNSSQPAQLNALAYTQGSDIHVAPGQERHLPHEAWHVVQQAQGRVQPTTQMKDGVPVNDDEGLEREADVMGAKAAVVGHLAFPSPFPPGAAERAEAGAQGELVDGKFQKGSLNVSTSGLADASSARPAQREVVQRKGEFGTLYQLGWKYSGGSMATRLVQGDWHASVFRVTSSGANSDKGLFYDGFHLTNEAFAAGEQPHVFFSHEGAYDDSLTRNHSQSKKFAKAQGAAALDEQIVAAKGLAPNVVGTLGPNLTVKEEQQLEAKQAAEEKEKADSDAKKAEEAAAKAAAAEKAAEQSASEDEQIKLLLADTTLMGAGALPAFRDHLAGKANAAMQFLDPIAAWYRERRNEGWTVTVELGRKKASPAFEPRDGATAKLTSKPAGKGAKNYTLTYTYNGYGSYRKDKESKKPPKV